MLSVVWPDHPPHHPSSSSSVTTPPHPTPPHSTLPHPPSSSVTSTTRYATYRMLQEKLDQPVSQTQADSMRESESMTVVSGYVRTLKRDVTSLRNQLVTSQAECLYPPPSVFLPPPPPIYVNSITLTIKH